MTWKIHMHNKSYLYQEAIKCRTCKGCCSIFAELAHNRYTFVSEAIGCNRGINRFKTSHLSRFVRERNDRLTFSENRRSFRIYRVGVV